MQVHSSMLTGMEIEELILSCKPSIERVAWKHVAFDKENGHMHLDFDDYVQVGMVGAWEATGHLERCTGGVSAYLVGSADLAMFAEYRRVYGRSKSAPRVLSLDAPLTSSGSFSLADTLSEKDAVSLRSTSAVEKRARAVRGAVKRLETVKQDMVRRHYGLEGKGRDRSERAIACELGISRGAYRSRVSHALTPLRKDARLCAAVGVEVSSDAGDGWSLARSYRLGRIVRKLAEVQG